MLRRQLLQRGFALAAGTGIAAHAQPAKPAAGRNPAIAQFVDWSLDQQDISKDFLIGSRAAWKDINARGGLRGRQIDHFSVETDGTPAGMQAALRTVQDNAAVVALAGTAGDALANQLVAQLRADKWQIAHVAPWLQNSTLDVDERTFPIFAGRQEQVAHALKILAVAGIQELGAVYASPREYALHRGDVERTAAAMKLRVRDFQANGDLATLGAKLPQGAPAILLFLGGTPELAQFTQGLDKQSLQRYVVALADVNLQTMLQMGGGRNTPVIATQAVPMVTSSLPVVRSYRDTLGKLFDEPPTPMSLAGFIAARYTFEVMSGLDAAPTRSGVLAAFQRRADADVGGFRVSYDAQRRSTLYVTQSMLSPNGRVVG